jgi:hypothetical protein
VVRVGPTQMLRFPINESSSWCIAGIKAGSSSVKFAICKGDKGGDRLFRGQIDVIAVAPRLEAALPSLAQTIVAEVGGWRGAGRASGSCGLGHRLIARRVLLGSAILGFPRVHCRDPNVRSTSTPAGRRRRFSMQKPSPQPCAPFLD